MDCPFCDINKEKTRVIKTYKSVYVVFSNPRLMRGHLLVVPKRHIEKISDLKATEKRELFEALIEFQEIILKKISSGCDIRQNYRPFMKQSDLKVNHLHFHLQPRKFKDNLYKKCQLHETDVFKKLSLKEKEGIVQLLKK